MNHFLEVFSDWGWLWYLIGFIAGFGIFINIDS